MNLAAATPWTLRAPAEAGAGRGLRGAVLALTGAVLLFQNPQERPAAGLWTSPLDGVGSLLFDNANKAFGLEALHFSLLHALLIALLIAAAVRPRPAPDQAIPPDVRGLATAAVGVVLVCGAWGLAAGGEFRQALWQGQQLLFLPLLVLLFIATFRGPGQLETLGHLVLWVAVAKAVLALIFCEVICRLEGLHPSYATTHSDSVLFVAALVLLLAGWAERGAWSGWRHGVAVPLLLGAIYVNQRRLAWVELVACGPVLLALAHRRARRSVLRVGLAGAVGLALVAAWASWNEPFKMASSVVSDTDDRSTQMRDIENFNLVWTLKHAPLGLGLGRPYEELSRGDDIASLFPQYRYVPHNSLLGLWAFGGPLGFAALWSLVALGLFLAARGYRFGRSATERAGALGCVGALLAYLLQAWGDMGLQSWTATFLAAIAIAAATRIAVAAGGWPSPRKDLEDGPRLALD